MKLLNVEYSRVNHLPRIVTRLNIRSEIFADVKRTAWIRFIDSEFKKKKKTLTDVQTRRACILKKRFRPMETLIDCVIRTPTKVFIEKKLKNKINRKELTPRCLQ